MTKEELRGLNFRIKCLKETIGILAKADPSLHARVISEWEARLDELETFKSWTKQKGKKK